jgi:pimeloyl-ACP methyl ester carboxylesterase
MILWTAFGIAPFSTAAASPDFLHEELHVVKLKPSLYEHVFREAILNSKTGDVRYVTAFRGYSRKALAADTDGVDGMSGRPISETAPVLRRLPDGRLDCDCAGVLGENEFLVSEEDVYDSGQRRYVSLNDESYKALLELIDYPLDDDQSIAVAFSELVYVYNARAIRDFLQERGFDLIHSYGFMDSQTYPGEDDTQFILVRQPESDRYIIAIRGTSGVADLKTNINAAMDAWIGAGRVHSGFARTTGVIMDELAIHQARIAASGHPALVLGHSLGGAASILLTIALNEQGIETKSINVAPPPVGDRLFEDYYSKIGDRLVNLFLPGEELDTEGKPEQFQWMRLVGGKVYLEDVGKTAGAVHFVINYLKSSLKGRGGDVRGYEQNLPLCVLEKFACFRDDILQFAPLCLFEDWGCFERHAGKLILLEPKGASGHGVALLDEVIKARLAGEQARMEGYDHKLLAETYSAAKRQLLNSPGSDRHRRLLLFRLGLVAMLLEEYDESRRFMDALFAAGAPEKIARYFQIVAQLLGDHEREAVENAVALFNADPLPEIAMRTRKLLWTEGNGN